MKWLSGAGGIGFSTILCAGACSSSSSTPPPPLLGTYQASGPGPIGQIEFLDATHYSLQRNAPCGPNGAADACTETGGFVFDSAAGELSLTADGTGRTTKLPLHGVNTPETLSATREHLSAGPPLTKQPGATLVGGASAFTICPRASGSAPSGTLPTCGATACQPMQLGTSSIYVSASSVEKVKGSLKSVQPPVRTPSQPAQYLASSGCLGGLGPIGAWGPAAALGPIGDSTWNPSVWVEAAAAVEDAVLGPLADLFKQLFGPSDETGPLGPNGPLSDQAYGVTLPGINDFCKQLQAGGVWTVLGPVGFMNPAGAFGPLGPIGDHPAGDADDEGNYPARSWNVRWSDSSGAACNRTYGLYEKYTEERAKAMTDNDTSFVVFGSIKTTSEQDVYTFMSPETQFVTAILVAENGLDDFDLQLNGVVSNSDGGSDLNSLCLGVPPPVCVWPPVNTGHYIDWVQLHVGAQQKLTATVTAKKLGSPFFTYRLYVVGSTQYINTTDITGAHQGSLTQ